jgi:hypothetical protein
MVLCQIPPSEQLAPADVKPFHDEVRRIEGIIDTAGDKCTVMYALARTWAAGGQYQEAMRVLEKVAGLKVGLDPSDDEIFAKLRASSEFERLLRQIRDDTPPVARASVAFTVDEDDLFPEGIAYESRRKRFFLGSTLKHKIVACTFAGECQPFVKEGQDGLGEVLGLRVNPSDGTLWAASNGANESGLFHYGDSGRLIRKYTIGQESGPHEFNDLVVDPSGDVFVTDTRAGTVYWVSHATDHLEVFNPALKVAAANGIAIAEQGGTKLYVAGFPDGITVVDVASGSFRAIPHPADLCLATIDGLYYFDGNLLAIQNGVMVHRVVRYRLTRDRNSIDGFEVLERRNPLFEVPTTAAIAEGALYFMANTQLHKVADGKVKPDARLNPIKVLRIDLGRQGLLETPGNRLLTRAARN